jgi:outer membrane protein assembly factor BamB
MSRLPSPPRSSVPGRVRSTLHFACLLVAGLAPVGLRANDWPTYAHDIHHSATTSEALPASRLHPAWTLRAPLPPEPAWDGAAKWDAYAYIRGLKSMRNYDPAPHVTVAGQRLWFGSTTDDSIHCLDTRSGRELWTFTTDGPVRIAPTIVGDRVYFGSDDGFAYCLEAGTGREIWRFRPTPGGRRVLHNGRFIPLWPCRTGVLVQDGTAYFAMGLLPWKETYLCAVDATTGATNGPGRYVRRLNEVTLEGSLLASSTRLISPQGRIPPLLFQRQDGVPLGQLDGGGGCFVVLTDDERILHGPGNKTGWIQESSERDRTKIATFNGASAIIVRGDIAYLLTDHALAASHRKTRRELWNLPLPGRHSLILAGDTLFAGGTDEVTAVRASDGARVWSAAVPGRAYGLAVADGALFASTDEGVITCFRAPTSPVVPEPSAIAATSPTPGAPATATARATAATPIPKFEDAALAGRWVFQRSELQGTEIRNLVPGGLGAALLGNAAIAAENGVESLMLDGERQSALLTTDVKSPELPREQFSAEAWVRVDRPSEWGGILGALQDNGDFERGWLLGFRNSSFCFAVAAESGPGRLTFLTAPDAFESGRWYHVLGTYDGATMRLFVNGREAGVSVEQRGAIRYPPKASYEIGAYHDDDEFYPLAGRVREVRVYRRAVTASEAASHAGDQGGEKASRVELASGPVLEFLTPDTAEVRYQTLRPCPTVVRWGSDGGSTETLADTVAKTDHRIQLRGLRHQRLYRYALEVADGTRTGTTDNFECDNFFNYCPHPLPQGPSPYPGATEEDAISRTARDLLARSPVTRGICLVLQGGDGRLAYEIARRSSLRVVMVDTRLDQVRTARERLLQAGAYGSRIAVHHVESLDRLPFVDRFADLAIVAGNEASSPSVATVSGILPWLRPRGGVALLGGPGTSPEQLTLWLKSSETPGPITLERSREGDWLRLTRGQEPGSADWTHQYGSADNSAYNGETLGGASKTEDLDVQWLGRPGPRAQPDRNGRKPAPLSTGGRLFVQGLQRILAINAYNGTLLWSREIPPLQRFNLPRDSANWCADEQHLYTAIGGQCWQFDAATGEVKQRFKVLPSPRRLADEDWGYLALQGSTLLGSTVRKGTAYTEFWGGAEAGWYDATKGPSTFKVVGAGLFALDTAGGERRWEYSNGRIFHSTLALAGRHLYFVESRHPKVLAAPSDRLGLPELWHDLHLVALDIERGTVAWDRAIKPSPGEVVFYLAHGSGRLVLVSSGAKAYHIDAFEEHDGQALWHTDFPWEKDNHGSHMSRPAIVGERLFVRPRALDLATGKFLEVSMPGGGCGTYAATAKAMFFRNSNVTVWDPERGYTSSWSRLRPDCWLSTIPASGLLLSPEGGGGCSCGSWMETSIVFAPVATRTAR